MDFTRSGRLAWPAHPVEQMPPQRVSFGQRGMVEIIGRRPRHTDSLHHGPRSEVRRDRERHDFLKTANSKAEVESGAGGFGGISAAPVLSGEPPSDLDAGREMGLEPWHGEPHESDEIAHAGNFDGPVPEPARRCDRGTWRLPRHFQRGRASRGRTP